MELLDDIEDHWDSSTHTKERRQVILRFQEHTKLTHQRVSFISGDCSLRASWKAIHHSKGSY